MMTKIENNTVESTNINKKMKNKCKNFRKSLGYILIFGRITGIIPFSNVFKWIKTSDVTLKIGWGSILSILGLIVTCDIFVELVINTWETFREATISNDKFEFMFAVGFHPAIGFVTVYTYYQFLFHSKKLCSLMNELIDSYNHTLLTCRINDSKLPLFSLLISITLLVSGVTENFMFDLHRLRLKENLDQTFLEKCFTHYAGQMSNWITYSPELTIWLIIVSKLKSTAQIIRDIFIIVLCQTLSLMFQGINLALQERITQSYSGLQARKLSESQFQSQWKVKEIELPQITSIQWDDIREDVLHLGSLTQKVSEFLSPLLLCCYCFCMYILITQIFKWLSPDSAIMNRAVVETSIYVSLSHISFVLRIALITFFASKVYHTADDIGKTIHLCPPIYFTQSAERLERLVHWHPMGISLFNTFIITRKFFVSIVSFIVTTEIVLLQTQHQ